jgi:hypothetical protein
MILENNRHKKSVPVLCGGSPEHSQSEGGEPAFVASAKHALNEKVGITFFKVIQRPTGK